MWVFCILETAFQEIIPSAYQLIIISSKPQLVTEWSENIALTLHLDPSHSLELCFPESPPLQRIPHIFRVPTTEISPSVLTAGSWGPHFSSQKQSLVATWGLKGRGLSTLPFSSVHDPEVASGQGARESWLWPAVLRIERGLVPSFCRKPEVLSVNTQQPGSSSRRSSWSSWSDLPKRYFFPQILKF